MDGPGETRPRDRTMALAAFALAQLRTQHEQGRTLFADHLKGFDDLAGGFFFFNLFADKPLQEDLRGVVVFLFAPTRKARVSAP